MKKIPAKLDGAPQHAVFKKRGDSWVRIASYSVRDGVEFIVNTKNQAKAFLDAIKAGKIYGHKSDGTYAIFELNWVRIK
jgi:hypothetical protein